MPKITVLCGPPCSGKSTYCKKYPYKDVISRDAIRLVYWGKDYIYSDINEKRVTSIFIELYKSSVKERKDIISDNTHTKSKYIDEYYNQIPEGYTIEVIFFDCPLWKLYIRSIWRRIMTGKWVPFYIIRQMKENFDKIDRKKYEKQKSCAKV